MIKILKEKSYYFLSFYSYKKEREHYMIDLL